MKRYKTQVVAAVTQVAPDSDKFKSIAAAVEKYGLTLKPQMDILYLESCLVSAGNMAGINENDDIFTRDEAWAARHSPVMKPLNWQHVDKDIVGVMYSIQARDLNGNILDFESDTPPDCDFDLYTEAVVWALINPKRADEIESRVKARDLFVSMEAWFDDYSYGMCDVKGKLSEVVSRDKSTAFLDEHLRVNKGSGSYDGKRIGRVLRSITFGGCGFVDRPANKRSFITDIKRGVEEPTLITSSEEEQLSKLIELLTNKLNSSKEEVLMNAQANQSGQPLTKADVVDVLNEREKLQAQAAEQAAVKARADAAEQKVGKLEQDVSSLNQTLEAKNAELQTLDQEFKSLEQALTDFVTEQVEAGATSSTPAEIAAVDAAKDGEAAFKAKLAWIGNSMASLRSRAARADELEQELVLAAQIVREQQVRALFAEVLPKDHVDALVEKAKDLKDEDFEDWMAEKELLLIDLATSQKSEAQPVEKKKMPFPPKKGEKVKPTDEETCAASQFRTLLESRNVSEADLINHPGGADVSSGLSSSKLKSVLLRHKVAGSAAGDELTDKLENAQPEGDNVNLAGTSQAGEEGEGENPFAALAAIVTEKKDKPTKKSENSKEN